MTDQKCPRCKAIMRDMDSWHVPKSALCDRFLISLLATQLAAAKDSAAEDLATYADELDALNEEIAALKAVLGQVHKWVDGLISYRHGDDEANIIDILSTIPAPVAVVEGQIPDYQPIAHALESFLCDKHELRDGHLPVTVTITTNEKRGEDDG